MIWANISDTLKITGKVLRRCVGQSAVYKRGKTKLDPLRNSKPVHISKQWKHVIFPSCRVDHSCRCIEDRLESANYLPYWKPRRQSIVQPWSGLVHTKKIFMEIHLNDTWIIRLWDKGTRHVNVAPACMVIERRIQRCRRRVAKHADTIFEMGVFIDRFESTSRIFSSPALVWTVLQSRLQTKLKDSDMLTSVWSLHHIISVLSVFSGVHPLGDVTDAAWDTTFRLRVLWATWRPMIR